MKLPACRQALRGGLAAWAVVILALPLWPQNVPSGEATSGVRLQLRLTVPATKFHQGELIPLELSYTSDTPKRYQIETSLQRICGQGPAQFIVTPSESTHDPERTYRASTGGGCGGDFATGIGWLSPTPAKVPAILNEFIAIDRPGHYHLEVISRQVSDADGSVSRPVPLTLQSNQVQFEIVAADPVWQRAEINHIRDVLDHTPPSDGFFPGTPRTDAVEALRFLTSEDAAREMARRLRGEESSVDFEYLLGLVDSPQRAAATYEMNELLQDPDFPVSDRFFQTLGILALDPQGYSGKMPDLRGEHERALRERLLDALPIKRGKALAASLATVIGERISLPPDETRALIAPMLSSFAQLPPELQIAWLQDQWAEAKGPEWLPVVRAIATRYQDFPEPREVHAWQSLQLRGAALRDWYELDPAGAREAVITEVTRARPRYDASVLGLLPDPTLPEAEGLLAENFLAAEDYEIEGKLASLLLRYADGEVLPVVLPKIEDKVGTWACEPQGRILAFALKAEPETAKPLIERALAARGPHSSACRHTVLTEVAQLQPSPSLEEIAIPALDDPDPELAANAAAYLGEYGSAGAEQSLWQHFQAWSQRWNGRAGELRFVFGSENSNAAEVGRGEALAHALATGVGWLADESMLRRLIALAVTPNMKQQLENDEADWERRPMAITAFSTRPLSFSLAQYNLRSLEELKTKLGEFPRGAAFRWSGYGSPEERQTFQDISEFASKNGLMVSVADPN
ncbi:MAG TPA: hypothetical protein VG204_09915 [Terriglobia bacterium]|nr:hypothetical protein [Terriglobia bacterium]